MSHKTFDKMMELNDECVLLRKRVAELETENFKLIQRISLMKVDIKRGLVSLAAVHPAIGELILKEILQEEAQNDDDKE